MEQLKSRIEAVLFVTAKVLQIKDIAEILEEEPEKVEEALLELIMDYASREGALEIDDENGYILQVKEEHLDIVEKLCPVELKPPVLKTLTVIALKEPIRQSLLKDLRGSNAYEHVQELLEKYDSVHGIEWHFIGALQTNKVKYIVDKVSLIHSVDREALADEIDRQAAKRGSDKPICP